ncbi:hypothetical protein pb186bvf_006794 [Paramecium bursaria]
MAMKALQEKVKSLEGENKLLQRSLEQKSIEVVPKQITKLDRILNQIHPKQEDDKDKKIRQLELQLSQKQKDYELAIETLNQQNIIKELQTEQRTKDLMSQIEILQNQQQFHVEQIENYKKKINELAQQVQKEKCASQSNQSQIDNFIQSGKVINDTLSKLKQELDESRKQNHQYQNYLDWYTRQYTIEKYQELESQVLQLNNKLKLLDEDNQLLKSQIIKQQGEFQIKLKQQQYDQLNNKLRETIFLHLKDIKKNNKQKIVYSVPITDNHSKVSSQKQNIKKESFQVQHDQSYQSMTRVKTKQSNEDISNQQKDLYFQPIFTPPKSASEKKQYKSFNQAEYDQITRRIMETEYKIKEFDTQYDMIVRQAQQEADIRVKQNLRAKLIQILANIKELNVELGILIAKQKSMKE